MKRSSLLLSLLTLLVLASVALQEIRYRRHQTPPRDAAAPAEVSVPNAELTEAVRQMSQARSELATAQHRLTAALQKISALEKQVQQLAARPTVDVLGPRLPRRSLDITATDVPFQPMPPGQPGRRSWGEEQATGAPDTHQAGDIPTAWASRQPDAGEEWLSLEYSNQVQLAEVRVRETYNPGAISRVVALLPNGQEQVIWEGVTDPTEAPIDTVFPVPGNIVAKSVKVYLDTRRVAGWNEIDAVEIVGRDGQRQWANKATASSSFAEPR